MFLIILKMKIRQGGINDLDFVKAMLFEAFFWNPDFERPKKGEFFSQPEFMMLVADWGRPGDYITVAEVDRILIGAAWFRLWTEEEHSYGFIDPKIPELGIGVLPAYRHMGAGRLLLESLIKSAIEYKYEALSLSVDPSNFARLLYESAGFMKIGESGCSWTYKLEL